ncbi:hypothetical protein FB451DRAFT_1401917 [Mycena latifolia]|nr:hypothetical protein FB451DRAFT_1401917 [Mycena latifolia]
MDAILRQYDEVFYATFPDARPGPRSARAEAEHARLYGPPELAASLTISALDPDLACPPLTTTMPMQGAVPPLEYGANREYAYPDPMTSSAYFTPQTPYWSRLPAQPPLHARPALHTDISLARAVAYPRVLHQHPLPRGRLRRGQHAPAERRLCRLGRAPPARAARPRSTPASPPATRTSPVLPRPKDKERDKTRPPAKRPKKDPDRERSAAPSSSDPGQRARDRREREREREHERERDAHKKPPLACLFCRGRKIACGPGPGGDKGDRGCK